MNYEIVELSEKVVAGFSVITSNSSPDMTSKIGALWQNLYKNPMAVKNRSNGKSIGLYCDYGVPSKDDYTCLAGFEVLSANENCGFAVKKIPAGKYAKFTIKGDIVKSVAESWNEIWNTPLDRLFTYDFEEYQEDCISGSGTIFIYIAVK